MDNEMKGAKKCNGNSATISSLPRALVTATSADSGAIAIVLGLLAGIAVIWEFHFLSRILESFSRPMEIAGHPTTQQIIAAGDK